MTEAKPLSKIVLGLTGGIAAYKSAELARLFVKAGVRVDVCMTEAACRFISPLTLQALSGRPVLTDLWASGADNGMGHIHLSRGADAIVVAPASADFLAKIAHGHADDLLCALTLARECPLFVAPAMNRQMWANAANQRNVATLSGDGVIVLGPGVGDQACGETGEGRMLEPEEIFAALNASRQRCSSRAGAYCLPPGRRSRRSTRCGASQTRAPARWGSRLPRRPRRRARS
jgi:phosphopantothenoylcysteine decarboxylase/phosphopantothenate--cysteine ligase